ncbi:hypothetical protein [Bacillus tuaregi]|uniref:hypothetical protein n=1 Tax=Bacillus tuaregi TaxID=1816695 RepID=UPI001113B4A8|nr:hypothetical protein [Bacillus tuaregi]
MVTISYLAVFILLGSLITCIDTVLFDYTFLEVFYQLFRYQLLQDRIILYSTCLSGLVWAIVVDVRIKRKKGHPKNP